ncbi:threonine transporter [Pleomorphomonas diazotrophica]|uniref:Threonine transporter n=1 Tax=Pleomorphomonas diazotrophica TaxID=1166257 RepID=A0A1I4QGF6_9HYPH|nr:LysE family translocator [Pleomorphomonas diazotrophica]PKR90675.1 threonine transporter [Pleomorphomonas diazotrophica]SFM39181.1 Threonine/homoserine/homoserine lactone efflux protein [Pleomorphomonas diazotrophica]
MSASLAIFSILGAILLGAVSPGPSFVLVSRISMKSSRMDSLAAALGMGIGGAIFATLALFGLVTILLQVEWLYLALRVLGGFYLVYLGIRIWCGASEPLDVSNADTTRPSSTVRSFALGLVTQLSNPKTAIVYASIFAVLLPASAPSWLFLSLPPLVFALETSWYAVVALAFSAQRPRAAYLRSKVWVDRAAGAVLGVLGARLVSETFLSRS